MQRHLGIAMAAIAAQLLTANLSALDGQVIADRVKHLEHLSKNERDQLDRNIIDYEQMNDEERSRIRTLHDELTRDRMKNGGLSNLLQSYTEWLDTLSPIQRDELLREKDAGKRIALIRKFKDEQDHKSKEDEERLSDTPVRMNEEQLSFIRRRIGQPYGFDRADLAAAMKVIVNDLPPERRQSGFEAPQLAQFTEIIHAHANWKQSYNQWPEEELLKKIATAISPRTAEIIKHSNAMGETPRETTVRLILMGIVNQADRSIRVSNEEREKVLNSLPPAERQRMERLSQERRNQALRKRYFDLHDPETYKRSLEVRMSVIDLFQQMDVKLPLLLQRLQEKLRKESANKG